MTQPADITNLFKNRESAILARQQSGNKIVGYVSNTIPLEIIHASGAVPLHLIGDVNEVPIMANEFMERAFDPITRSIFNRLLTGAYNFLDLIVLPRCNDSYQRLYYYLREINRKYPQYRIPPVYLLDLLHTPWPSSQNHNNQKIAAFARYLTELNSNTITDASLQSAIALYNTSRQLLKQFTELRADNTYLISSEDACQVYGAAQSLAVEDFNRYLSTYLDSLKAPDPLSAKPVQHKPSLVIAGNGVDHPRLHQLIDHLGARVVGDYHSHGNHFLVGRIDPDKAPLAAITEHYHHHTISSRTFSPDPQALIRFCQQQNADGILFYFLQGEEALTWQVPSQQASAKIAGLPCCVFYHQSYDVDANNLTPVLKQFIQSLSVGFLAVGGKQ